MGQWRPRVEQKGVWDKMRRCMYMSKCIGWVEASKLYMEILRFVSQNLQAAAIDKGT
jgi:hypothetical protein